MAHAEIGHCDGCDCGIRPEVPVVGTDFGCSGSKPVRINPGETWDMDSMGYCAPEVSIHKSVGTEVASVSLSVTFTDDDGRSGSLSSSVMTR